jgi:hypothetical protein
LNYTKSSIQVSSEVCGEMSEMSEMSDALYISRRIQLMDMIEDLEDGVRIISKCFDNMDKIDINRIKQAIPIVKAKLKEIEQFAEEK